MEQFYFSYFKISYLRFRAFLLIPLHMIVSYISYVIVMCTINHFAKNLGTQTQKKPLTY